MTELIPLPTNLKIFKSKPTKWVINGPEGQPLKIKCKSPTEAQKTEIFKAFAYIDEKLTVESFRKIIRVAMHAARILITGSLQIGAVSSSSGQIVILNARLFDRSKSAFEEFSVTIIHELLHLSERFQGDKSATSEKEAVHDILAYTLLGLDMPRGHWALQKYPHLREQLSDVTDSERQYVLDRLEELGASAQKTEF